MDKHVSKVCSAGFHRLRQLRRVRRSLDSESVCGDAGSLPSLFFASTTVMYCWRAHRRLRLTTYSISWMWLHVLLVIRESTNAVWGSLCMSTFIGSTWRNEWSSSSCRWCVTAFITRLAGIWWTTAFQSLMWPVDDIFVLPGVITSLCIDTVSARMGVGHLLLPAQLPGTHLAMICVIRRLALTVSYACLKLGCFRSTSTQRIRGMRYINSRLTYLLTYIGSHVRYKSTNVSEMIRNRDKQTV